MAEYGLALHTASHDFGLALAHLENRQEQRCQTWDLGRELSIQLHLNLAEFLAPQTWADLAFLAVAQGPGGFTSTRIGVVTARTLAQQLEIPLFAVSTLEILAWAALNLTEPQDLAVQMQAQRGDYFVAIYQPIWDGAGNPGLVTVLPDTVLSPADWQRILAQRPTPYRLIQAEVRLAASVTSLLDLALQRWQQGERPHWSAALPFYGQHPVAGY